MMARHGIDAAAIDRIDVRTSDYNMRLAVLDEHGEPKHSPSILNEAQFSVPFTMAAMAVRDRSSPTCSTRQSSATAGYGAWPGRSRKPPASNALASKEGYASADAEVHLANGATYVGCEPNVKGHPGQSAVVR